MNGKDLGSVFARGLRAGVLATLALGGLLAPVGAVAAVTRSAPALQPQWAALDAARLTYRDPRSRSATQSLINSCNGTRESGGLRSYSQMLTLLDATIPDAVGATLAPFFRGKSPRRIFRDLVEDTQNGFAAHLDGPFSAEATAGLQEALNELIATALLRGNDLLIKGLRTRFPAIGDPSDPDQLTLLRQSALQFEGAMRDGLNVLRERPGGLRASGTVLADFPFFVENAAPEGQQGETVESELYRLTEIVSRYSLATNSIGGRLFFFNNCALEREQLVARQECDMAAGRADAARTFKKSAQAVYVSSAVLAAAQSPRQFSINNGPELKRLVVAAESTYDDIQSGFNPLELLGDFVPSASFESRFTDFKNAISHPLGGGAAREEEAVKTLARTYDVDQTALASELSSQRAQFLSRISQLTGVSTSEIESSAGFRGLREFEDRERFRRRVVALTADPANPLGLLRQKQHDIEIAAIDARAAQYELDRLTEAVKIEEDREGTVYRIRYQSGVRRGAYEVLIAIAQSTKVCVCGLSSGVENFPLEASIGAAARTGLALLEEFTASQIEGANSLATVRNLLLQAAAQRIQIERASAVIDARKAELAELYAEVERVVQGYVSAQRDLACAYFTNPAYRLQLDFEREKADASFELAMVQGYYAAKALEYEWAERYENPVQTLSGAPAQPIGDGNASKFAPFVRAESVFSARSAGSIGSPSPTLAEFAQALQLWDSKMRSLRVPEHEPEQCETFSLRKQILRADPIDDELSRLEFRDYVARHRIAGPDGVRNQIVLPFSISIKDSQRIFSAQQPNLKLTRLALNLESRRGGATAATGNWSGQAFKVNLVMLDQAMIRTFFAQDFRVRDDLRIIELAGARTYRSSPFRASVQATLDGIPAGELYSEGHRNRSPAVTRWLAWLDLTDGQNANLIPELVDDLKIRFCWTHGKPRQFDFR